MLIKEAVIRIKAKYKDMDIIEAMPGNNKFIFCLKPKNYPKDQIVMDSYYYVDSKGNIGEYPYLKFHDEWAKGMDNKYDLKNIL